MQKNTPELTNRVTNLYLTRLCLLAFGSGYETRHVLIVVKLIDLGPTIDIIISMDLLAPHCHVAELGAYLCVVMYLYTLRLIVVKRILDGTAPHCHATRPRVSWRK